MERQKRDHGLSRAVNVVLSMGHQERRYLVSHTSVMSLTHRRGGATVVTLTHQRERALVITLTHQSKEFVCIGQVKKLKKRSANRTDRTVVPLRQKDRSLQVVTNEARWAAEARW